MKTEEMERTVLGKIKEYNALENKSQEIEMHYNFITKEYYILTRGDNEINIIYSTPFLGELEGLIEGLIISTDHKWFGDGTKNPMYRYILKERRFIK
jgi:hypothetical protein